jgi:outer membrane lipoprotein SlyB
MKKALLIPAIFCFAPIAFAFSADARPGGCLKGAIVGGIAGHFVGHGGIGATAGCAYGMHRRKTYDREMGTMDALATNSLVERRAQGL